jgi:hypothetical protein
MPVIRGADGTISESFRKISGKHSGKARHKSVTESGYCIGNCAHSSARTDVEIQDI